MANSKFRPGRSVFTCCTCKRQTREAGQAIGSDCCPQCYDLAGLQNMIYDGVATIAELAAERDQLFNIAVKRGGNGDRIKREFSELWAA